jgi:NADH-quinone oxidoreductase subunit H
MGEIKTLTEFVKRVITVVLWLVILTPMIVVPVFLIILPFVELPIPPLAPISDPLSLLPLLDQFMQSDLFRMMVFPGFTFAALFATAVILIERKTLARLHYRIGPLYAGKIEGVLQPIADLFKLLFKELIIPSKADRLLFLLAPLATFAVVASLLAVVPLAPDVFIIRSPLSLLIFFAIIGFFPLIVLAGSWASSNKFSFIGGLRALHQMISYEVPLLLGVLGVVVLSGSFDVFKIAEAQSRVWFIVPQFLGAFIFLVASLAELERIPFDLPEADTELVAGWMTEYSSMAFGLFQLAIYIKFYALTAIFTALFLGGWYGPAFLPPVVWFVLKTSLVTLFMIFLRGSNPRVRIDLLIRLGWGYLVVLAFINLFIAVALAGLGII